MKTQMVDISISELRRMYTISDVPMACNLQPGVVADRLEGMSIYRKAEGYVLRLCGTVKQDHSTRLIFPGLQLYVPCESVPFDGPSGMVNLTRGFSGMPELSVVMNLVPGYKTSFFFCRDFHFHLEQNMAYKISYVDVCNVELCDPAESSHILIATEFPDDERRTFGYNGVWNGFLYTLDDCTNICTSRISYSLVPIGFRYMPEGEAQSVEDIADVKSKVIRLANRYLGIETAASQS